MATPVHQVTLTNGFYLGKYEVTQAQYETVMTGNSEGLNANPSNWHKGSNRPVEKVSWNDVQVFLSRLNDMEQTAGRLPAGWKYVLPTEAQWEYACRAGLPRPIHGAMISILPLLIIIGTEEHIQATTLNKPVMWECMIQRLGLFRHARKCLGMGP